MNKIDRVPGGDSETIARRLLSGSPEHPNTRAVGISAITGEGIDRLLQTIDEVLPLDPIVRTLLHLPPGDGATLAMLHEFGRVLSTRYTEEGSEIEAEIPQSLERRLASKG
jgi:GTP-binding protein HflX